MNADGEHNNGTQRQSHATDSANPAGAADATVRATTAGHAPTTDGQGGPDKDAQDRDAQAQDAPNQDSERQAAARPAAAGTLLPNKAAEDDPRRWGDQPGSYDHDAWLREQRPPHWG